jgi:hypothetical protein
MEVSVAFFEMIIFDVISGRIFDCLLLCCNSTDIPRILAPHIELTWFNAAPWLPMKAASFLQHLSFEAQV